MTNPSITEKVNTQQVEIDQLKKELAEARQTISEKDRYIDGLAGCFEGVMFLYNMQTNRFELVGENIERIYGYTREEINELPGGIFGLIYEEDLHVAMDLMEQTANIQIGQNFKMEYRVRQKCGQIVWTAIWATPYSLSEDGALEVVAGVKLDTSAFKAVETQNVVFDHMVKAMFSQKEVGISLANSQGKWLRVNDRMASMLGYEVEELLELTCPQITPSQYIDYDRKEFDLIMTGNKDFYESEKEYLKKDGSKLWVSIHAFSIKNIHSKPEFLLSVVSDVSKEVQHVQSLEESENRFKNIVESSKTWFWEVDVEGRFTYLSRNNESMTGYTPEELLGTSVVDRRVQSQQEGFSDLLISLREEPKVVVDLDGQYVRKDGRIIDVVSSGIPIFDEAEKVYCYRGSTTDITDRKNAEREAKKNMSDLESSNKELEQFAYAASHDLQEPVRLMSTYTQLLREKLGSSLEDDNIRIMDHIVNSSRRMSGLINGLMEFSRVGKQELILEIVDCTDIINAVVEDFRQKIKESNADVSIGRLPEVLCDPLLVNIVFHNILCNSIKFAKPGQPIKVDIDAIVHNQVAEFTVKDNGIGIKEKYLEEVFIIFKRLNSRDDYDGDGIGMSVARKIVELHGCKIWAESTFGEGTTIHFTLPIPR
jgi:PAS domain S-box-containing protein